ncbi:MAG: ABC transporter permease [Dehalococcoidia bacterium]|nr:ABC transporter permease [Dehalococcoidia bacterium]
MRLATVTHFSLLPSLTLRLLAVVIASISLLLMSCGGGSDPNKITVQLDWTPNTNHLGIYVALAQGWYEAAGLDVEILPYTDVAPDTIVAAGQADFGVSFPPQVVFSRAAGLDIISVAAVMQRSVTELAVLDSSDIRRPRDFDGRVYAGFGLPYEEPQISTVIKADGGQGNFDTATLSTAAYEAIYNRRADFTEIFTAWEGIEAELRGIKLRTFRYDNYGVPDIYSVVLIAGTEALSERADDYRRFLDITRRGYEFAAQNPAEAARVFLEYPALRDLFPEPEMVRRSAAMLAPIYMAGVERWGGQDEAKWDAYMDWLVGSGVVTDDKDQPVTQLRGGRLFTNQLLTDPNASSTP